jgi:excisionase family DNA binding protein
MNNERLLDAREVAELLHVPVSWVRAETRAGRIPHLELGRYKRYHREAVLAWLVEQQAGQWRKYRPRVLAP